LKSLLLLLLFVSVAFFFQYNWQMFKWMAGYTDMKQNNLFFESLEYEKQINNFPHVLS
jgi:hypothetical protein